ncbi:MAG: ABC transporter ATP-binding protein [Planctomycetota bacterium]
MVAIRLDRLTKRFADFIAVNDVSVTIREGELFFLLGPSGCGKTTLLRLLAGFYTPDAGGVYFDDVDMSDVPPEKRNAGMVFQNYALWPHMTVRQNIDYGLKIRKLSAQQRTERIQTALEMVRMTGNADSSPNQLSGGQQQRIALARALASQPDVVLMDEPLSNLDAKLRLEMRSEIKRIHDETGRTMIYVTHDQSEALSMADRIAVMRDGRIAALGSPRDIYDRPTSPFVAGFIGEANLIPGTVSETGGAVKATSPAGTFTASVFPDNLRSGDSIVICVRPERLHTCVSDTPGHNRLTGIVKQIMYMGAQRQLTVAVGSPNNEMILRSTEVPTDPQPVPGSTVILTCAPDDVVILRPDVPQASTTGVSS